MILKAVFPGKYIQGEGVLEQLPQWVKLFGKKGLIIASGSSREKTLLPYAAQLQTNNIIVESFGGECCETELSRLAAVIHREQIDVLVGMGGGKAIDTAKIAADRAGLPVIVVPTIASTDAPCSGCAVIYTEDGAFESVYYQKMNPQAVLVDTRVIVGAPVRYLVSGMGDALATWFEARSCNRTQSTNACGGHSTLTGLNLAKLCYDTLMTYGRAARIAAGQQIITPAVNHIIEANILLSGLGFESGGLGAAHSIHNGLTAFPETHDYYHGEKVAFGVLAGLSLADAPPAEADTVYQFCEDIGLPTTLTDLGLPHANRESLMKAAQKACAPEECIHHEAGEISPDRVLNAMLAADAMGRARKK